MNHFDKQNKRVTTRCNNLFSIDPLQWDKARKKEDPYGMKKLAICTLFITIIVSLFVTENLSLSHTQIGHANHNFVAQPLHADPSPVESSAVQAPLTFDQQIDAWIQHLANKDKHMYRWKQATWTKQPLGPGLHGWLILITHEGEDVGYLVVSSVKEDGSLRLVEYGTGPYPLYSQRTLQRSLEQYELNAGESDSSLAVSKRYFSPLQAIWEVDDGQQLIAFDAVTGEMYPPDLDWPKSSVESFMELADSMSKVEQQLHLQPFDPFESIDWVDNAFIDIAVPSELIRLLDHAETLTYAARIFNERMLIPFAVSGYHLWSNETLYVCLEYEGKRFISFPELLQFGEFYPKRD